MEMEKMIELIDAVSKSDLTGFKYEEEGIKLHLSKRENTCYVTENLSAPVNAVTTSAAEIKKAAEGDQISGTSAEEIPVGNVVESPLVGTFYAAPAEDAESFVKVGDRVALEPGKTCGHCEFCKEGKYNLCPDVEFFATPPVDGVFQEYVAHEAGLCFKLPDNVSTLEGALIEPLAVGFHAAIQGDAHLGQKAVVMGAGCIGLVSMMALKARGVTEVYVVDIMEKRLEKALELGATGVINGAKEDVAARIKELTAGKGADLVIETAGSEITTRQAIQITKKGATIVLVGYSKTGEVTLPMSIALDKELTFKTVFRYRHIYPMAIDAVASGKVNLKGIVTDIFDLDDVQKAMDYSIHNKAEIVKGVIKIHG